MITSINLSSLPFLGSCDSTRTQMAAKQIQQSLTHLDCEIPYVISSDYRELSNNSTLGIFIAPEDGVVKFCMSDILVVYYHKLDKLDVKHVPLIKHSSNNFSSKLRFCLPANSEFKKGDVIFSYDSFRNGVPSFGYNVFTGYFNFMGYNHEDGLVVSESFMNRTKSQFTETVIVPIYEHSLLQPIYEDVDNSYVYFPSVGQKIKDDILCNSLEPKVLDTIHSIKDKKQKMMSLMKSFNVSDLINSRSKNCTQFSIKSIKSKIHDGIISGIKIHHLKRDNSLVDSNLEKVLNKMYQTYIYNFVTPTYETLNNEFGVDFAKYLTKKHLIYTENSNNPNITNRKDLKDATYLIEFEIYNESTSLMGDKFCNRYANKGVVSFIIPDELRPIAAYSKKPIDCVFSPFSVFSRMNLSQLLEGMTSKNVMYADGHIRENPELTVDVLTWLNEDTIKHFGEDEYYNNVKELIIQMQTDNKKRDEFVQSVMENNLYIEAPAFSEVNVKKMFENSAPPNEDVRIPKKLLEYMKQELKIDMPVVTNDMVLKDIFCAPIYIMKLYKLVDHIITARDLGPVKYITKQPLKGRANEGGSKIGQMEIEGILSHGCERVLKEMTTVKSDLQEAKNDLIKQIISTGEYNFPDEIKNEQGHTMKTVSTLMKALE